ncbi:ATP synthase E chain-domain-containing protein [Crepidotus variabilis]|uniref:ATP synthase F(0) complex subunit e, mitochondrial n=1 Tax=Crepidotus variabilis TaxID=179855 RepID=A0A9P6JWY1_9AGAR|nr:ATP synthase E chain-domain-containing protein [Crepidotus variabilis]
MASTTTNVVRYTALFSGVLYGWSHRRSLQSTHDKHALEEATHNREKLIHEAKEAWKRKLEVSKDTALVTDPEDPRFDLDKLIAKWEQSS